VSAPLAVGVDAAKVGGVLGWVAVALASGRVHGAHFAATLTELVEWSGDASILAIDIPLGAARARDASRAERRCDTLGRARLGRRRSTLYPIPPLEVLEEPDHARASALCRELTGKGVSRQSHGLRRRILEALPLRDTGRAFEVHPELSFLALTGLPELPPKKTWEGAHLRRGALEAAGIVLPGDLGLAGAAPVDDLLDAAAAAWTAARIASGEAECLPSDPEPGEPVIWI
jgi:predicted RNase H-like nuclease